MSSQQKFGALVIACLFTAASVLPAHAQRRGGSGSGSAPRGGQGAAPRSGQGSGPSAGQRPAQRPGPSTGARPPQGPGYRPGGPAPGYRPGGPASAHRPGYGYGPGYRPGYGPSYGYRYPYYGYRYPYYGYRGYYPWYGYGGYYGGYYPGVYWGVGAYVGPSYYGAWPYVSYGYSNDSGYDSDSGGTGLKLEVKPKTAEVFVDGLFAGTVDQYDGMFDSLPLDPGEHEITIYQEGYRSIRQRLVLSPGSTYRLKGALEQLGPGEPNEPRPQAPPRTEMQVQPPQRQYQPPQQYLQPQAAEPQGPPPGRPAPESSLPLTENSKFGQVAIRVQPGDAEVLIDGEAWRAPAGAERLAVFLSPGTHRIEIRKEGFDSFVTAVEIRRGEVTPLNVSLARF